MACLSTIYASHESAIPKVSTPTAGRTTLLDFTLAQYINNDVLFLSLRYIRNPAFEDLSLFALNGPS